MRYGPIGSQKDWSRRKCHRRCSHDPRIQKLISASYERIVARIAQNPNDAEREAAQMLLGWMVCAKRPLRWHEIQGAVSLDTVNQTFEFEQRQLRKHIRELCGSLIDVLPGDRVELVHGTAKL
jgi:hypothetical protein